MRYGLCVGRPGFAWLGPHTISAKKEWPDWVPLEEMVERQPYLPHFMPGGRTIRSSRALYLGSSLLPQPQRERTLDDRQERLVRLHPLAQR
jgi:lipoprotein-anchoring transpeptidase ErfK/SrfK